MKGLILLLLPMLVCCLSGCASYQAVLRDSANVTQTEEYQEMQMFLFHEHMQNNFRSYYHDRNKLMNAYSSSGRLTFWG